MFVLNQTLALDEGKWSIYIYFTKLTNTLPQWLYTLRCRMLLRTSVTFPWPLYLFDPLRVPPNIFVTKNRKKGLEPLPYHVDPPPPLKAQKRSAFEVVCVSFPSDDVIVVPSAFATITLPSGPTNSTSSI